MATHHYSIAPHPVDTLLTWAKSDEIAIPAIQRPFVWKKTQVRDLLDSLYRGYPVGYLIAWRNSSVQLKDGSNSSGKRILIDGQQRVMALMAALHGRNVLTKDYKYIRIRIAFHPVKQEFKVCNSAILKDAAWLPDLEMVVPREISLTDLTDKYAKLNPASDRSQVSHNLEHVRNITNNPVGVIELNEDLGIEKVTEIFIRINSAGATLSQADFVMSKIASNETHGGNMLRKAIDNFCHWAVAPKPLSDIEKDDKSFAASEFLPKMRWLRNVSERLYHPSYKDMLHVAFTSEFQRGQLQGLVALLSERNSDTKQQDKTGAEDAFAKLKTGIHNFINETHFNRLTLILCSAGFVTSKLIRNLNAVNFAYILYLRGKTKKLANDELNRLVCRWYVMSLLSTRYSGSSETAFDNDIRQIEGRGLSTYCNDVINAELTKDFWSTRLPEKMKVSSNSSPYFLVYQAAQAKLLDRGFLSLDTPVRDLLKNRSDMHHVYPRNYLKGEGLTRDRYNQIANFVRAQSEINNDIGDKSPRVYFAELAEQCNGGTKKYGGITDITKMRKNFRMNCLPETLLDGKIPKFDDFLDIRRKLMVEKIKRYYEGL